MAKIENVDYNQMPNNANEIGGLGVELNSQITKTYESLRQMHNSWYGVRYNDLVMSFNNMIPSINEMLKLVVQEIPTALINVANNYSMADTGMKVSGGYSNVASLIEAIEVKNDVGMRFIEGEVNSYQNSILSNFKTVISQLNSIKSVYDRIDWKSDASYVFENRFNSLKTQMENNFEETSTQFKNLMEQAVNDLQHTESSNTL